MQELIFKIQVFFFYSSFFSFFGFFFLDAFHCSISTHLLQEYCEEHKTNNLDKEFDQILKMLYDTKVVSEQAVLGWASELADSEDPDEKSMPQYNN